ncbi:MAG TPA: DMT family transporter, partial [Actinomycetota bacterium]|nr:DMT family transporter [Actinomycetota bacterium]
VAVVSRRSLKTLPRSGWFTASVMGAFLTAGYIFQTFGLEYTTASHAGFITGLFVVLTPIFGAMFFKQKVDRAAWIASGASAIGLYLLSGLSGEGSLFGDALVFGCACSFAFHILVTDKGVKGYPIGALLAVQLGVCGLFSIVVAGIQRDLVVPDSSTVWSALLVTSLFASALGFFVQTYAQKEATPARTALILASEPAFAGLFAYLLNGESLTPLGWAGAGLIMAAILTVEARPYLPFLRPLPER